MIMVMDIEVLAIGTGGDIQYSMKLVDTSVGESTDDLHPESIERMRTVLKSMVGFAGTATVSSRGETKEASFQMPENADQSITDMMESMKNSLKQMSAPLPEAAVGPGAKWEVTTHVTGRLNLDQTATVTLVELKDQKFHLSMDMVQTAPKQKIQLPMPGSKVELVSLKSTGKGTVDGELGSILPVESHVTLSSAQKMEITRGDDKSTMQQSMDMDMDMKSGRPAAASPEPAKAK
jgi:mannose/fructose/N-acetylgalactosamine-specific phosphotransferase system component IIB